MQFKALDQNQSEDLEVEVFDTKIGFAQPTAKVNNKSKEMRNGFFINPQVTLYLI